MKKAFSLFEIIFVITIVALISTFILKNSFAFLQNSNITKVKAQVSLIRSGINSIRNQRLKQGLSSYAKTLDSALSNSANELLFTGTDQEKLLDYPLKATTNVEKKIGSFAKLASTKYRVFLNENHYVDFVYSPKKGTFNCSYDNEFCKELE